MVVIFICLLSMDETVSAGYFVRPSLRQFSQTPKLKRFRPYSGIISCGFPADFRWISSGYPLGGFVINENKHSVGILCIETIIKDRF